MFEKLFELRTGKVVILKVDGELFIELLFEEFFELGVLLSDFISVSELAGFALSESEVGNVPLEAVLLRSNHFVILRITEYTLAHRGISFPRIPL